MNSRQITALVVSILIFVVSACQTAAGEPPPFSPELMDDRSVGATDLPPPALAGNARFDHLSLEQGLSQSTVTAMLQDSQGFMWFGTRDGLNRYDGYSFKVLKHDSADPASLADNAIASIFEDRSGTLWIGTEGGGLERFDRDAESFTHYRSDPEDATSISSNTVTAIVEDPAGTLWVGTDSGLNRFDHQTETFSFHPNEFDPLNFPYGTNYVTDFIAEDSGRLWIATLGGLLSFEAEAASFRYHQLMPSDKRIIPNGPGWPPINSFFQDDEGLLWLATDDDGLIAYEPGTGRTEHYTEDINGANSLSHNTVHAVYQDQSGKIWAGTQLGLDLVDPDSREVIRYQHDPLRTESLSDNEIRSLYADESGVLWIGTLIGGINKLDPYKTKFRHVRSTGDPADGLSHPQVLALYQDDQDSLWIGTGDGLNMLDPQTGMMSHYIHDPDDPSSLSSDYVTSIVQDQSGVLWIGTHGGLNRLNRPGGNFSRVQADPADSHSLSSDLINALFEDQAGYLWVGTDGVGLSRRDPANGRFDHYSYVEANRPPETLGLNHILSFQEDDNNYLWIGTMGGLIRFDQGEQALTYYRHEPGDASSLAHDLVNDIHLDQGGRLWLATGGGLDRYDPAADSFSHITEEDGLPNNMILGILEDSSGLLWISSNHGLTRYDPDTGAMRNYDTSDGLQSFEFNRGARLKNRRGEMLFGGVNGFNVFQPEDIRDNPYRPPLVVTDMRILNESVPFGPDSNLQKPIEQTDRVKLSGQDTVFSFELAALHYGAPDDIQYAYLMEGFDKTWNFLGNRRYATYTNLPPGNYTFRAVGSNSDGVWNEEGLSLEVLVPRPFWQSLWFISLVFFAILAAVYGGFRLRSRSLAARTHELEEQVARRTVEIERRRQIAEGLREILVLLNSQRSLEESLHYIVAQAAKLTDAEDAVIFRLGTDTSMTIVATNPGGQIRYRPDAELLAITDDWAAKNMFAAELLIVPDLDDYWSSHGSPGSGTKMNHRALLGIPLLFGDEIYGGLIMFYAEEREFSDDDLDLGRTFGDQAILAIANDGLRRQAAQTAVASERSRLARELHDAVTQTIFSASLLTETLGPIWESDQDEGRKLLSELRQLTRGALAEMRTLLLELRPSALEESRLPSLLGQLAEAVTGRTGIPVETHIDETRELPVNVRIALYRIAQEALNNVVKHARASQVTIALRDCCDGYGVILTVRDNGRGFDPEQVPAGRLGLGIIRERAAAINARLSLTSTSGQGTTVEAAWEGDLTAGVEAGTEADRPHAKED
ncbi:MAG: GAF domain-containing protein [Chloroflexota bacterium]|nr:MAG: GAF domain-containing protein [Chloroflexota bacterium]